MKAIFLCALLLSVSVAAQQVPVLDVSGFSWAENQAFDNNNNLFVADTTQGIIYRVYLDKNTSNYVKVAHLGGFSACNGITYDNVDDVLYAAVSFHGDRGNSGAMLIGVDPHTQNSYYNISTMKAMGNGLAWDPIREVLYSTNEGNFVPGEGFIMQIIPKKNSSSLIVSGLNSVDGCQILNENYMYISEVLTATFLVYDITDADQPKLLCTFTAPPGVESIDDFTLSDGQLIYGADYRNATLVSFENQCNSFTPPSSSSSSSSSFSSSSSSSSVTYIMGGLLNPTSCYFAPYDSTDFNTKSLFVSEGGSVISSLHNRHVLQSTAVK